MKKAFVLSFLCIGSMLCLTGCNKKDTSDSTTTEQYYAKNEVTEMTSEDAEDEPSTIAQNEDESVTTETPIEYSNYSFNVDNDTNATENLTEETISIDGKLISFPCDYQHLKSVFSKLYVEQVDDLTGETKTIELDETQYKSINLLTLMYKPTTGYGSVKFIIRSIDGSNTNINNLTCNEVILAGNTTSNDKLMTLALKDNIHFGSTIDDIKNAFGNVPSLYNVYDNDSFVIKYIGDETGHEYYFSGKTGGLANIDLKFNMIQTTQDQNSNIDDEED